MKLLKYIKTLALLGIFMILQGCVKYPQLLNFRNTPEFVELKNHDIANQARIIIQPDDVLFIMVRALEQETAEPFNLLQSTNVTNIGNQGTNATLQGYLVDINGNIDFPVLGRMKVSGLSVEDAKSMLMEKLKPYLRDPVIMLRFLNFRLTVLGEVGEPKTIQVPGERMTILEALGAAGDLTPYSNREKIMVIREQDGKREFGYVNIHSQDIFQSPYFYLHQNDIIYVEPIKEATVKVTDPITEVLPIASTLVSVITLIIVLSR
jgi:polysaccharide biosynthesis/export protein